MTDSDLTADLPAPRDDEPPSLRADIVDELSDHLQCAVRREELRSNQETSTTEPRGLSPWPNQRSNEETNPRRSPVYQRVLARFGDPAAVARKLWWDAMWEKVMGQRILTGLTLLAVAACCAMAVLMWQMITQMQGMQRDLLAESQAQNTRLLEQFQALVGEMRDDAEHAAPAEWVPLTVKCTFDSEDGPPAAGVMVKLRGDTERTVGIGGDLTSDATGVVDFGKVLYARYDVSCMMPNGMSLRESVSVRPGQPKVVKIVCPNAPPPLSEVKFDIQPPETFQSFPLYYLAVVETASQTVNKREWSVSTSKLDVPSYLLGADGTALGEFNGDLSTMLRERLRGIRRQVGLVDASTLQRLQEFQSSVIVERPAYRLSGRIMVLMADPENTEEAPPGQLPARLRMVSAFSPNGEFATIPDDMTNRLGGRGDSFWTEIAERLKRYLPGHEVYGY